MSFSLLYVKNKFLRWTRLRVVFGPLVVDCSRHIDAIPPTKHVAHQHIRCSILAAKEVFSPLQAACLYISHQNYKNNRLQVWMPHWTDLPDAALNSCGCKKSCTGNCKYSRVPQRCMCACEGMYANNEAFNDDE